MRKIYLISAEINGDIHYKIGYTKRPVWKRIKEFKTGNVSNFNIVRIYKPIDHASSIERSLHRHFIEKKINGEWFDLNSEDIDNFLIICEKYYNNFNYLQSNSYMKERGYVFK